MLDNMRFLILVTNDQKCWKTQSGKLVRLTPFWGSVITMCYKRWQLKILSTIKHRIVAIDNHKPSLKKSLLTAGQSGECTSFIVRSSVWRKFWLTHSTGCSSVMMKVIKWDHKSVKIHSGSQPDVDKAWRRTDTV